MNIVVAMKQIPDLQQIRIRNRQPVLDDVPLTFGNIDKNALEAAVQLKEAAGGQVIVVCAGTQELEDTVKEALAAGADEARLVVCDPALESSQSARLIAAAVQQIGAVDLILFGEGSGDNYSSQVSSRVAQILGLPQVGYANNIQVEGSSLRVTRSLEDCEEILEVPLPAVVSVTADINEARIPSVTQILKAGRKPKETWDIGQLGIALPAPGVETISNLAPETERKQVMVKTVADLVKALETEGFGGRG
ncbi:MAG: electron transfer flavoprotein subunit beta/FixA family protein [Syntrophomonadaceae bacterium]